MLTKLKAIRKKQKLSQVELSTLSNVSQTAISAIERGTSPKADTLSKLAKALNVSIEDLLKNDDSALVS